MSALIERFRNFLACLRDCLEFFPKPLKQLPHPLLGVGLGGPRRLPGCSWGRMRRLVEHHAIESDLSGTPRSEFLAFRSALSEDVD